MRIEATNRTQQTNPARRADAPRTLSDRSRTDRSRTERTQRDRPERTSTSPLRQRLAEQNDRTRSQPSEQDRNVARDASRQRDLQRQLGLQRQFESFETKAKDEASQVIDKAFDGIRDTATGLFGDKAGGLVDKLETKAQEEVADLIDGAGDRLIDAALDPVRDGIRGALGDTAGGIANDTLDAIVDGRDPIDALTNSATNAALQGAFGPEVAGVAGDILQGQDPLTAIGSAALDPVLDSVRGELNELFGNELGGIAGNAVDAAATSLVSGAASALTGGSASAASLLGAGGAATLAGPLAAAAIIGPPTISGVQNLLAGNDLSTSEQAALALPTFGASFLVNPIKKLFGGSKKSKEQLERDAVRDSLRKTGLGDKLEFPGVQGTIRFDFGKGQIANIDQGSKLARETVALTNALAQVVTGGKERLAEDFNAIFANAVLGQGLKAEVAPTQNYEDVLRNTRSLMKTIGITPRQAAGELTKLYQGGKVTAEEFKVGIQKLATLARV